MIRAFVIPTKRERLLALFGSANRRKQAVEMLNHFQGWDTRWSEGVSTSADVLRLLRNAGAAVECHIISDDPSLDGRNTPLHDAVIACESFSYASVLCCVPGQLAFYFDEMTAPRRRLLLRRPATGG